MTAVINKVPFGESTNEQLVMLIDWKDDSFDVLLTHNQTAWLGSASSDHVKELSQIVDMTIEDYITETKSALSTLGGLSHFSYHVADNQFVWKKVIQNNIKIRFGYVSLEETSYAESSGKVLDALMQQNCSLQVEVSGLQKATKRAATERAVLMEKLVEYKKQKLEMERELYSQFVAVLNKKKQVLQQDTGLNGGNVPSSTMSNNSDHYESDTEVENTDNEEKDSTGKISDEELFETEHKSPTTIPRRIGRQKRMLEQLRDEPGPSKKTVPTKKKQLTKKNEPIPDATNTQDLWDEL